MCYCGTPKCRGFLGAKEEKDVKRKAAPSGKRKRYSRADVGYLRVSSSIASICYVNHVQLVDKFAASLDDTGGLKEDLASKSIVLLLQEMMHADSVAQREYILGILMV